MLEVICVPQYISYFYTPFYSVNAPNWQTTHSITRHYAGLYLMNYNKCKDFVVSGYATNSY